MSFLQFLRDKISPQNGLLLLYHRLVAMLAAIWFGFPADHLRVIAVTGTKGKSTVVHFLASILEAAGHRVGVASTIHFQIGDRRVINDTKQTTQGRFTLQRLLSDMVQADCEYAILEATSHALIQSRLWGVNVDTAVLTNIQRDHLEYHGGFEEYLRAKGKLFDHLTKYFRKANTQKTAVLPAEDPQRIYFESFPSDRKMTFGLEKGFFHASHIERGAHESTFFLTTPYEKKEIELHIPGDFTITNALAAAAAAASFGIPLDVTKKGLEAVTHIPGRLESVDAGQNFPVIVDYAHTPESLESLLKHFRAVTKGKLFLVFGATGGGRDKAKRPQMGGVASRYADYIMITDDDPYTEDRMSIINQVALGVKERIEGETYWKILGRREAIALALSRAREHDCVLIAGKGCEPIQIIGTERIPWDDRKVVKEFYASDSSH